MRFSSQRSLSRALLRGLFIPFLLFSQTGLELSALPKHDNGSKKDAPVVELAWPLPPDPPRVRYVGSLQGASDFKKKPSRWRRFFLGPEPETGIHLRKPYGVTTDSAGRVYVTDTGLGAVIVFDAQAREVRSLGASGRLHLITPIGIALDDKNRVYVSDADLNQVFCFGDNGEVLLALGREEGLENPTGLALDPQRQRLYVADSHLHKIFIYSTDGEFLDSWGSRGTAPGKFNFPTNLTLGEQGNLHVVDTGNFRVQILSPEGKFLSEFGEAGDGFGSFHRPKGIALDSEGHVYVADAAFNNFQIFNQKNELLLFVGTLGKGPGNFWLPAGMHIDASDRIYVVDQVNRRVQIFQYLRQEDPPAKDATATEGTRRRGSLQYPALTAKGGSTTSSATER